MSKLNVTKGEWSHDDGAGCKNIVATSVDYSIATVFTNGLHDDEVDLANAALICDAANTYNKTGFTPGELAQQVDEMREALEMLYNAFPNDSKGGDILFGVHQLLTKYPKK